MRARTTSEHIDKIAIPQCGYFVDAHRFDAKGKPRVGGVVFSLEAQHSA